jgi:hypothetical protein
VGHSADPDGETGHRGGSPDVSVLAAEDLGQRQSDVDRMNLAASDALVAVRRDALPDGYWVLRLLGADAEKLAVPERACLGPDDWTSVESAVPAEVLLLWAVRPLALVGLDKPAADRSGAQSFAVQEFEDGAQLGQRAFAPALRYRGLVLQELVAQYWPPEVKAHELPEEQQARRLRAA